MKLLLFERGFLDPKVGGRSEVTSTPTTLIFQTLQSGFLSASFKKMQEASWMQATS